MADVVLGIDFGTCLSSVVVRRSDGSLLRVKDPVSLSFSIPSSVAVDKSGALLFGTAAERVKLTRPFVDQFKRHLGDETPLALGNLDLTPAQLIGRFLRWLRDQAELTAGDRAQRVVITVPASYEQHRRDLMLDAARGAGFDANAVEIVHEPVAATAFALADRQAEVGERLLVYDLGGGTFDVAVVAVTDKGFEVLSHDGGSDVGGTTFDRAIATDVLARSDGLSALISSTDNDLQSQARAQRRRLELAEFCRDMKHQLSVTTEQEDWVPGTDTMYELTRAQFDQMIETLLAETLERCDAAVEKAGLSWPELARVVMVGGSTRIPAVATLLETTRGQHVQTLSEPELAVAEGAAMHFGKPERDHERIALDTVVQAIADDLAQHAARPQCEEAREQREESQRDGRERTRGGGPKIRALLDGVLDATWSGNAIFAVRKVDESRAELVRLDPATGKTAACAALEPGAHAIWGSPGGVVVRVARPATSGAIVTAATTAAQCYDPELRQVGTISFDNAPFTRIQATRHHAWALALDREKKIYPKLSSGSEYRARLSAVSFADGSIAFTEELEHTEFDTPAVRGASIQRLDPSGNDDLLGCLVCVYRNAMLSVDKLKLALFMEGKEMLGAVNFGFGSRWSTLLGQDLRQIQHWNGYLLLAFGPLSGSGSTSAVCTDDAGLGHEGNDIPNSNIESYVRRKWPGNLARWVSGPHGAFLVAFEDGLPVVYEYDADSATYTRAVKTHGVAVACMDPINAYTSSVQTVGALAQVNAPDRIWIGMQSDTGSKLIGLADGQPAEVVEVHSKDKPLPCGTSPDGSAVDVLVDGTILRIQR